MIALAVAVVATIVAVVFALVAPQTPALHYGWVNAALAALVAWGWYRAKPRRLDVWLTLVGTCVLAFAFVANGLLAPDTLDILGAPGQEVRSPDDGSAVSFPAVERTGDAVRLSGRPQLASGHATRDIWPLVYTADRRYDVLRRTVVYVSAYDARGGSLTITQPSGSAFLSPVLLMSHTQTIAGLNVPFDSFAVPAAHRLVKCVYFTAAQSAVMHGASPGGSGDRVLFAVDDQFDVPLPHAIVLAGTGERVSVAGIGLRGITLDYPQIRRTSIPNLFAVGAGLLLLVASLAVRIRSRS